MVERGYEGDLQLDLLATQGGRGGQCCDQVETLRKLSDCFNQSGALQRPLSGFAPKACGLFDQPGFGAVARQNLRLVLSDVREVLFESFGNASVQRTSRLAQKGAVGGILHQRVFEQIRCVRWHSLAEQQALLYGELLLQKKIR